MRIAPRDLLFLFPLTLFVFVGGVVQYVNVIIPTNGRWIILAVLAATLLVAGRLFPGLRSGFGSVLVIYAAWGFCTYFWSNVPLLTLMKSVAFALVSVTLLSAGQAWVRVSPPFETDLQPFSG